MRDDITASSATSARHRADLEFRRLLDKLPAAAYTCDADGLITYYNQRAAQAWGRAPNLADPQDHY
jgi:two-component system, LuxR family, sensor kinase FixL